MHLSFGKLRQRTGKLNCLSVFFLFFLKCGCRFAIALIMLDLFWKLADAEVWKEADHVVLGAYCIMI